MRFGRFLSWSSGYEMHPSATTGTEDRLTLSWFASLKRHECASLITVSCTLSKVLEYLLLPSITDNINFGVNQFGFQRGLGCQHAHIVPSTLLSDASRKGYNLYFVL